MEKGRYHSLDAMRGILMIMGIYFHLAIWYAEQGAWLLWFYIGTTHMFRMHAFFLIAGFFGALLLDRKGGGEMVRNRFKRLFLPLIILSHPVYLLTKTGEKYAGSVINEDQKFIDEMIKHFNSPWEFIAQGTDHLWFLYLLFVMSIFGYLMSKVLDLNVHHLKRIVGLIFKKPWLGISLICFLYATLLTLLNIHKAQFGHIYGWFWFGNSGAIKSFIAFSFFYFWGWQLYYFRGQFEKLRIGLYLKMYGTYFIIGGTLVWSLFHFGYPSPYDEWNDLYSKFLIKKKVTFLVDMSTETVVVGEGEEPAVYLNITPWSTPHGFKMEESENNLWSHTMDLTPGEYTYKFRNGYYDHWGPPNWENGDSLTSGGCGYGDNGPRKFRVIDKDLTLGVFCWSKCTDCSGEKVENVFQNTSKDWKQIVIRRGFIFLHNFVVPIYVMLTLALFTQLCKEPSKKLRYISDSSYWIYVIHVAVIPFAGIIFYSKNINLYVQFFLTAILTTIICFLSYHYLVRKTFIGKFLNGKKFD